GGSRLGDAGLARAGIGPGGIGAGGLRPSAQGETAKPDGGRVVSPPALAPHALAADREEAAARSPLPGRQDGAGAGSLRPQGRSAGPVRDWMTDPADLDSL